LDLELAERVVQISRVVGAAAGLLVAVGGLLEPALDEELRALLHGPALGVELDAHDVPAIAEQGLLELGEPDLRVPAPEALVDHHLLRVVRPALGVGAAEDELARLGGKARRVEELEVVAGPDLV